ncbi:hypothetical protein QNO07_22685 [Streptomyces sp. 549]|uniref:hypothetical protein n=1 Tax=Streptomyces sp. 549 TaxID=3049076 RepID=UPI0024C2BE2D|nr:hypothetical protein [Streptomyces sp. 549]MDK1476191.1 hypothetical protein [Streptomyces sp. 549]
MPYLALFVAVLVVVAERVIEARYGVFGAAGVILLAVGIKSRNATCSCMGAAVLTVLLIGPGAS